MTKEDIKEAESLIKNSQIVICQGEICESATKEALLLARNHGGIIQSLFSSNFYSFHIEYL